MVDRRTPDAFLVSWITPEGVHESVVRQSLVDAEVMAKSAQSDGCTDVKVTELYPLLRSASPDSVP